MFAPNAFARVADAWRQAPNTDVFFGDMYITDEADVIIEELRAPAFCAECQIYEGMQVFNQSLFIRRDCLNRVGLLDERLRFVIDYELVTRLGVEPGVRFQHVDGFWGGFRKQPDAKTSTLATTVGLTEHQQVKERYRPRLRSAWGAGFWLRYCRLRKLATFVLKGEFGYVRHRWQLRRQDHS